MPGLEDLLAAALARYGIGPGAGGIMPQAAMGFADEGAPGGVLGGAEDMTPYSQRPRIQITPNQPPAPTEAPPPLPNEFFGLPASTVTQPGLPAGKEARPTYVMSPRLSETQMGLEHWAPEGAMQSDTGELSYPQSMGGQTIPVIPRHPINPYMQTPEGRQWAMPGLLDLAGYILGGPVPQATGEMVAGSGMIRGRPGVPAIAEGAAETAPMAGPAANLAGMSQAEIKAGLPPPLSAADRAWQNYGRNMRPEDVLGSEAVWGAANQAAEQGAGRAEGFAAAANDLWRRMGANQYITPELAKRYMAVEEARARGMGTVPGTVLGAGSTGERGTAAQAASLAAGIENRASLSQALEGAPASPQGVLGGIPGAAQQEAARGAMPPAVVAGAEAAPAAEAAARTGRQEAITAVNLREMPLDEAMRIAATERHLIPSPRGGYVGAPNGVETPADIARMRAEFDRQVDAGVGGRDWYIHGQGGVREMAGPVPARQSLLARAKALWSAQSTPETNLGFTLAGHNAWEAGTPAELVRTGQQARTYNAARESGEPTRLGPKTDIYGRWIDPTATNPVTGTNDIWHARAFGYRHADGTPWDAALTPQQHAFLDAETLLAVRRANDRAAGGHTDWTPGQVQAAAWVNAKAEGLQASRFAPKITEGMTQQQQDDAVAESWRLAREEAVKGYPDYFEKHTAHGTYEAVPGAKGHLPELAGAPLAEREAYTADPRALWTTPEGRDVLYDAAGFFQRPTERAQGMYTPPGEATQFNPVNVARPMVSMEGQTGARSIDAPSQGVLSKIEAFRAFMDAQNAGAWSMPVLGNKQSLSNSLLIQQPGGRLSEAQMQALGSYGPSIGLPDVINYGNKSVLTDFGGSTTARDITQGLKGGAAADIEKIVPGANAERAQLQSNLIDYYKPWLEPPGSGAVTRELERVMSAPEAPAVLAKLDADPRIRQAALDRIDHSAEVAARTGQPVREDLQLARKIIAEQGLSGLFAARRAGVAVPAVLGAVLLPAFASEYGKGAK